MRSSRLFSRLTAAGRAVLLALVTVLVVAAPADAKTFATTVVHFRIRINDLTDTAAKITDDGARADYYGDHLPEVLGIVDDLATSAAAFVSSHPDDGQVEVVARIGAAARAYGGDARALKTAVDADDTAGALRALRRLVPDSAALTSAVNEYRAPLRDVMIDDPYFRASAVIGAVLALLFVAYVLTWVLSKRSTILERERRHARARLAGRAFIGALMIMGAAQLYRVPDSITSIGVRAGCLAIAVGALVFFVIGEVHHRRVLAGMKVHGVTAAAPPPSPKGPKWAPQESTVTQHIIPVGDIVPLSTPNDGVLLLGDFLRTGDEDTAAWHVEPSLVAAAVSGAAVVPAPTPAPAPRPVDAMHAATVRDIPPPPPPGRHSSPGPLPMAVPQNVPVRAPDAAPAVFAAPVSLAPRPVAPTAPPVPPAPSTARPVPPPPPRSTPSAPSGRTPPPPPPPLPRRHAPRPGP